MIKITVTYSVGKNDWFDMDYYINKHVPMSQSIFSEVLKGMTIDYITDEEHQIAQVTGALFFESVVDFYKKFIPAKDALTEDTALYTNSKSTFQISEIKLWRTSWEIGI
jgi:uncharacterized protein (TIGR02118 family)